MKIFARIALLVLIPTVFIAVSLNFLFWLGEREEENALALASVDADLVVEQYITDNNDISGLIYAKNTMHWEQGKLKSMRFMQRYATEEQAAVGYQGKAASMGAATQLLLDGTEVSYYLSTEDFEDVTYQKMRDSMDGTSGWYIIEELSGEYPTGGSLNDAIRDDTENQPEDNLEDNKEENNIEK